MAGDKAYPTDPQGELDAGLDRQRTEPCARRIGVGPAGYGWCWLADGHDGMCRGKLSVLGELPTFMPKGATRT